MMVNPEEQKMKNLQRNDDNVQEEASVALLDSSPIPMVDCKAGSAGADHHEGDGPIGGMSKEELENYVKDPFWRKLRLICFVSFWFIWLGMLAAVVLLIVVSPKCPPRETRQFWQKPFYRVQIRSFAPTSPSNNNLNKVGTLAGLKSKLPYLTGTLGFENFIIGSLIANASCPQKFNQLDPSYGTEQDLRDLMKLGRKKGLSFLMEFDASQAEMTFGDGSLVASNSTGATESRDGQSVNAGNFLHSPRSSCYSLDVTKPKLLEKLKNSMRYWLDAGFSGFVLTNVAYLVPGDGGMSVKNYSKLFSNASAQFVKEIRAFLNEESGRAVRDMALFVDIGDLGSRADNASYLLKYTGNNAADAVIHQGLGVPLATPDAKRDISGVLSDASVSRHFMFPSSWTYLQRQSDPVGAVLSLTLPGVPVIFYGQELGMGHVSNSGSGKGSDGLPASQSTDLSLTPMQWSNDKLSAGWLTNTTQSLNWSPKLSNRADDIGRHNVRTLTAAGHPNSTLDIVADLVAMATSIESLQWGQLIIEQQAGGNSKLFAYVRHADRFPPVLVVINTGGSATTIPAPAALSGKRAQLKIFHRWGPSAAGIGANEPATEYSIGNGYELNAIYVPANSTLLFVAEAAG